MGQPGRARGARVPRPGPHRARFPRWPTWGGLPPCVARLGTSWREVGPVFCTVNCAPGTAVLSPNYTQFKIQLEASLGLWTRQPASVLAFCPQGRDAVKTESWSVSGAAESAWRRVTTAQC